MIGARLGFTKYTTKLDQTQLSNYLEKLAMLHQNYLGVVLCNLKSVSPNPKSLEGIAHNIIEQLSTPKLDSKHKLCKHEAGLKLIFEEFSWDLEIRRFSIRARAFVNVIGSLQTDGDGFAKAYGDEEEFLNREARSWIEQGICNDVYLFRNAFTTQSDAWGLYISYKNYYVAQLLSLQNGDFLDACGEFSEDKRCKISTSFNILESSIRKYYKDLLKYSDSSNETSMFVQGIDSYFMNIFGRQAFAKILSPLEVTLDQWTETDNINAKPDNASKLIA